jgi:hypothetical protein
MMSWDPYLWISSCVNVLQLLQAARAHESKARCFVLQILMLVIVKYTLLIWIINNIAFWRYVWLFILFKIF